LLLFFKKEALPFAFLKGTILKLSLSYEGSQPPAVIADLAQSADSAGADTFWAASHLFQRDPIVTSTMALSQTKTLRVGLMAMSPYVMHPVHIAMAAAALDEWFPGRVTLCFGTGSPRDLVAVGVVAAKPLRVISETIALTRALFAGEMVNFAGQTYQVENRRLTSGRREIPIVVAASGPKMLELAGAEADGVLISAAASPQFIAWALAHVAAGEAKSGRRIHKAALVYGRVSDDGHSARQPLRRNLAFVLRGAHHAHNLALAGTQLDQAALTEAYAAEDWTTVDRLVDDDVLDNHTASGTPAQVRAALAAYEAVGLDEIVLAGLANGPDLRRVLRVRLPAV
jgi:5,10-methylenetetrahydromethanopterin reductase